MDVRVGIRSLHPTPDVTVAVVLMLALGIGANAAMYSLLGPLFLHVRSGSRNQRHSTRRP
jgi:hypothetical protein